MRATESLYTTGKDDRPLASGLAEGYFRYEWVLFVALGILQLVPIWSVQFFATLDGPVHVGNILTYMRLDDPGYEVLRTLFQPAHGIAPNYFVYAFLYAAMHLFDPPVAEKLFLSLYVLALPLALRYALGAFGRSAVAFAALGFPMAYTTVLFLGFYNTSFALVAFLLTVGFWLRHRNEATWRGFAGYAALALFCFCVHLSAVAMTALYIGVAGGAETLLDYRESMRQGAGRELWRRFVARCVVPGLAYIVPVVGIVIFLLRDVAPIPTQVGDVSIAFYLRVARLLNGPIALAYSPIEWLIVFPFVAGLAISLHLVAGNLSRRDLLRSPLFFAFVGLLAIYLFLPYTTYVRWMTFRTVPYLFLGLFIWLGSAATHLGARESGALHSVVLTAAVAASLATASLRPLSMARVNDFLTEYVSAFEHIEPGSTVLPVPMGTAYRGQSMSGLAGIDVFYQAQHYLIWQKPVGLLLNGQATVNYFPIVFRPGVSPFTHIDRFLPEFHAYRQFDLDDYRRKSGVRVDTVILWGEDANIPPPNEWPDSVFFTQLARDYEQVYRSPQRGLQRVYRRKTT